MLGTFVECGFCHALTEDTIMCPTCGHDPTVRARMLCGCGQPGCGDALTDVESGAALVSVTLEQVGEHVFVRGADPRVARCDNCGADFERALVTPCGPR